MIGRSVRFSDAISYEALKHEGADADKETRHKKIFQYPLLSFQTMAIFQMTMMKDILRTRNKLMIFGKW